MLAVTEVFEHSVLFFEGLVNKVEVTKEQRRCKDGNPLPYLWPCAPRLAQHALVLGEHRLSVAEPQVHALLGLEHDLPVLLQGAPLVQSCVFVCFFERLDEISTKLPRKNVVVGGVPNAVGTRFLLAEVQA